MSGAAEEFRGVAGRFGEVVAAVPADRWDAPAPVDGWVARDVVRHLVEWFPGFLAGGSDVVLPPVPSVDDDPVVAWESFAGSVQSLLDDPATADRSFDNPHTGSWPLPQAVSQFFTSDVFLHTWDLAVASGQDPALDPERCAGMLAGMEQWEEAMRSSGQYGPRVPVPDDAPAQDRLMGFIGRDPAWRP
ncbi:maleylpyruvate isomerase family mycothiol-dependent enzyme [Nocardioides aestuarii]|uniref:TIGR03086 family metal-binding protein n=1 Tax=Nocardioides aestuarii TaxID=252231 RepID=A0ABW4TL27_9ACTN